MKRSRFREEQIIAILREQESGAKTADVCRKHGISDATFYKWKAKFGGMEVSDARRLKVFESENAKLKKLLAEAMLDNAMLKDIAAKKMVTPAARREAVVHLCAMHEVSQRRACSVIGADRTSVRYRRRRPDDRALRERLRSLASERRRFGYRVCTCCSGERATCSTASARRGSTVRKGCRSADEEGESGPPGRGRR